MCDKNEVRKAVLGAFWEDINNITVSVDVSTCEETSHHRVFGKVIGWQQEADGSITLLAEEESRTFEVLGYY